jgi:hypothetical protein
MRPPAAIAAAALSRNDRHSVWKARVFRRYFFGESANRPKHEHRCTGGSRYDVRDTPSQGPRNTAAPVSSDGDEIGSHQAGVVGDLLSDILTDDDVSGCEKTILTQSSGGAEQIRLRRGYLLIQPWSLLIGDRLV